MSEQPHEQGEARQKPAPRPVSEEHKALLGLLRAFKLFLGPFLASWALAYLGGTFGAEWLYFTGLGGVGLSMLALLVWLIS